MIKNIFAINEHEEKQNKAPCYSVGPQPSGWPGVSVVPGSVYLGSSYCPVLATKVMLLQRANTSPTTLDTAPCLYTSSQHW